MCTSLQFALRFGLWLNHWVKIVCASLQYKFDFFFKYFCCFESYIVWIQFDCALYIILLTFCGVIVQITSFWLGAHNLLTLCECYDMYQANVKSTFSLRWEWNQKKNKQKISINNQTNKYKQGKLININ